MLAERGRLDEARHELDLAAGEGFATLPKDVNWLSTLAEAAEVAAIVGSNPHAETLYALLAPYAQLNVVEGRAIYCYGTVAYYLGLLAASLGRLPAAVEHLESARACHERMDAGPLLYRTLQRQAQTLLRSDRDDDRRRAGEIAHEALMVARAIGM